MKRILSTLLLGVFSIAPMIVHAEKASQEVKIPLNDGSVVSIQADYKVDLKAMAPKDPPRRKMAIFVKNNVDKAFDRATTSMRNQIAAQVSGSNLEIMDYAEVVAAIAPLVEDIPQSDIVNGQFINKYMTGVTESAGGRNTTQDQKLLANTSYTRLAENMGADYVMMVTLDSFTKNKVTLNDKRFGGKIVTERYKMSASYKVLDAYTGTSLGGDTLRVQESVRQTQGLTTEFGDFADNLEEELSQKLAASIRTGADTWREASLALNGIEVTFSTTAYDMNNQPIYLPKYDKNKQVNSRIPATIAASIEIDGVTKGSTTCTIPLAPGMHKVRFTRPGYDDLTMTITPREGLNLAVNMRMTASEYERIKDSINFMNDLTMKRELNQAEVMKIEGAAKMLEQSGIRIDVDELPENYIEILN